ncbi:MAG: hypothetical protein JSU86_11435 [Phycisphaerales bacterium]|nr:MAG: hypothetical protein JSU86_11435 [Phycisphaerales bacterium]
MSMSRRVNVAVVSGSTVRLLAMLAMLPGVVLSPLGAEAILIHHHHGHDIHSHSLTFNDLDVWQRDAEHRHEEHEHDGQQPDSPTDDSGTLLIMVQLPEALLRVRGLSTGNVAVSNPTLQPRAIATIVDADTSNPSCYERLRLLAPNPRACGAVAGILLSSHALLI